MRYWSLHEISDQFFRRKTLEDRFGTSAPGWASREAASSNARSTRHLFHMKIRRLCDLLHHRDKYYHLTILIGMFLNYLVLLHLRYFQLLDVRKGPQRDTLTHRFALGTLESVSKNIGFLFVLYKRYFSTFVSFKSPFPDTCLHTC